MIKATKPEGRYIEPSEEEIRARLQMHDMADNVDMATTTAAVHAASHLQWDRPIKDSFLDPGLLEDPAAAAAIQAALEAVDFRELTGSTPVQKAIAFNALTKSMPGGMPGLINSMKNGNPIDKRLQRMAQQQVSLGTMKSSDNEFAKEMLRYDPNSPEVSAMSLSEEERATLTAMAAIAQIGEIKSRRVKKMVAKTGGNILRPHLMEYPEQVSLLLDMSELIQPDWEAKLASQESFVRRYFEEELGKLAALIMIDRSSSMIPAWKQGYVRAIMLHYFDLLSKGEATVYLGTFEQKVDGIKMVTNVTEAKEYYNKYRAGVGSTTDVNAVIEEIQTGFQRGKIGKYSVPPEQLPELIIVNDGQDRVEVKKYDFPTHVISLEVDNENLAQVAKLSDGSYNVFQNRSGGYPLL